MNISDKSIISTLARLKTESPATPSASFRTNAKIRLLNTISAPHPFAAHWYQKPLVFRSLASSALATVIIGTGTVYAAQSSNPVSPLYPVKIISERVALTLSPSTTLKNVVANTIISRRIEEIETIQESGDPQALEQSIEHFDADVESLNKRSDVSREEVTKTVESHREFLNTLRRNKKSNKKQESDTRESRTDQPTPTQAPETTPTPYVELNTEVNVTLPEVRWDNIRDRDDD